MSVSASSNYISMRNVLMHFLTDEASRDKYATELNDLQSWRDLTDDEFFARVSEFASRRNDINPVLTWTIGTLKNEHHKKVKRWSKAEVSLDSLYTCGLNSSMKEDIDSVGGNIAKFAMNYARKYPEFRLNETPPTNQQQVIAVRMRKAGRDGVYQLIDGAHRAVALVAQGKTQISAFVAELE